MYTLKPFFSGRLFFIYLKKPRYAPKRHFCYEFESSGMFNVTIKNSGIVPQNICVINMLGVELINLIGVLKKQNRMDKKENIFQKLQQ